MILQVADICRLQGVYHLSMQNVQIQETSLYENIDQDTNVPNHPASRKIFKIKNVAQRDFGILRINNIHVVKA